MSEQQKKALVAWLDAQAYNGRDFGIGPYLILGEMKKYLPAALERILATKGA